LVLGEFLLAALDPGRREIEAVHLKPLAAQIDQMATHAAAKIEHSPDLVVFHELVETDHIGVRIEPVARHIGLIPPVFIPPCHGELLLGCAPFPVHLARFGQVTLACCISDVKGIPYVVGWT
jgi:hypothetical protein